MKLKNRVEKLEKTVPKRLPNIEVVLVDSPEQVEHPERFDKVLVSTETYESGGTRKMFELKRKQ